MSYGKYCIDTSHRSAYECARCHDKHCMECDLPSLVEEVKTIVRYCQDWRCQREKRIEETDVAMVVAVDTRAYVRDRFTPGSLSSLDELQDHVQRKVVDTIRGRV